MSEIRKEYLKKALTIRYEQILLPTLKKFLKVEKENHKAQNMKQNDTPQTQSTLKERLEEGRRKAAHQERTVVKRSKNMKFDK